MQQLIFGKKAKGRPRKVKVEKEPAESVELKFYCPLLKLRSTKPVCAMLKSRPSPFDFESDSPFRTPYECLRCDGRPADYQITDYSLYPTPRPVFSPTVYKHLMVKVLCGALPAAVLTEYREMTGVSASEVAEGLGGEFLECDLLTLERTGKGIALSKVLGLPSGYKAIPVRDRQALFKIVRR